MDRGVVVTWWNGHHTPLPFSLSLSCFPLLLAQCICFQAGLTQAWDIPCCGPLKPETLEVDVCLRPVCCQTPRQVLQMWPSAPRHSGRRPVALSRVPCPRLLGPLTTTTTTTAAPAKLPTGRPGSRPPWAGQQPLLTPAIKLKSYSLIPRL